MNTTVLRVGFPLESGVVPLLVTGPSPGQKCTKHAQMHPTQPATPVNQSAPRRYPWCPPATTCWVVAAHNHTCINTLPQTLRALTGCCSLQLSRSVGRARPCMQIPCGALVLIVSKAYPVPHTGATCSSDLALCDLHHPWQTQAVNLAPHSFHT